MHSFFALNSRLHSVERIQVSAKCLCCVEWFGEFVIILRMSCELMRNDAGLFNEIYERVCVVVVRSFIAKRFSFLLFVAKRQKIDLIYNWP